MASGTTNTLLLIEASALAVVALTALLAPATLMLHIAGIDAHGVAVEPARWAAGPLAAQAALDLWLVVGGLATLPRTLHLLVIGVDALLAGELVGLIANRGPHPAALIWIAALAGGVAAHVAAAAYPGHAAAPERDRPPSAPARTSPSLEAR